jgi:L-histidine N-alpha-methyltransferase
VFNEHARGAARIFTFFGMIPNFEPQMILPKLAGLISRKDLLLFSANLAPGSDYLAGTRKVLPLYDNALTRDWLMTFLLDLGVEKADGKISFRIEDDPGGLSLKRIAAYFVFSRPRTVKVQGERFEFRRGETIRLFFSYRHTPQVVGELLAQHGLAVQGHWITRSQEEGVFLCRKA